MAKCEFCGKGKAKLVNLGRMVYVCQECLDDEYLKCDRCGNYNDPMYVQYYHLKDGSTVCRECYSSLTDVLDENW